jgi:hypothetical protein
MSNIDHRYTPEEAEGVEWLTYLFLSEGKNQDEDVFKIIQYEYAREFGHKSVFNLGFGDLDMATGEVNDEAMAGNGDVFKVFNTVLSTVPEFFNKYPGSILLVQGSDGREAFEAACRVDCSRHCGERCHNYNRRMKTYCNYVTKKYDIFNDEFQFLGGMRNADEWFDFEYFVPGKIYDSIMVYQKNP